MTIDYEALADELVSSANILTVDGFYGVDTDAVGKRLRDAFDAELAEALRMQRETIELETAGLIDARDRTIAERDAVIGKLHTALAQHTAHGCPACPVDCSSAETWMVSCPTQAALEAYRAFDALNLPKH